MARSLTVDGTDLSGTSYGLTVVRGPIPVAGPLDQSAINVPLRHGGVAPVFARYSPREIEAECYVHGSSWSNLQSKLDAIAYVLRPESGPHSIVFDERNDRRWYGWLVNQIDATPIGNGAIGFTLRFLIPSGMADGASETTQSITLDASPDTVTVPATGTVGGTAPALPVWKIQNTTGGAVSGVTIANSTTSETVQVTYSIANNAYVRFNAATEMVEYSTDDSAWTSIMSGLSSTNNTFPTLAPRVANTVVVTGVSAGTMTLAYRTRFHR